jgi:hypothetical protein
VVDVIELVLNLKLGQLLAEAQVIWARRSLVRGILAIIYKLLDLLQHLLLFFFHMSDVRVRG